MAAPKAISFYDFLNGRTVTYEEYLDEQLALSDIDGYYAMGYQEWVRPGGVEQMSRELCRYADGVNPSTGLSSRPLTSTTFPRLL